MEKDTGKVSPPVNVPQIVTGTDASKIDLIFTYAKSDLGFYAFGHTLDNYMETDGERLGISAAARAALTAGLERYFDKLDAVRNNPNHGHADVVAKDLAKTAASTAVDTFINTCLRNNALWTKEDEVKAGFGRSDANNALRPAPIARGFTAVQPALVWPVSSNIEKMSFSMNPAGPD